MFQAAVCTWHAGDANSSGVGCARPSGREAARGRIGLAEVESCKKYFPGHGES